MKKDSTSKTFCVLPWIHMATFPDGSAPVCCVAKTPDREKINLNKLTTSEIVNSDYFKDVRKEMLQGKVPDPCQFCFKEEENGVDSYRINQNKVWFDRLTKDYIDEIVAQTEDDGTIPFNLHSLDLRLGNVCNLKCIMCQPQDSSKWVKDNEHLARVTKLGTDVAGAATVFQDKIKFYNRDNYEWYKKDAFKDAVIEQSSNLKHIIIAGGEPLFIKEQKELIERLVASGNASNITIAYHTNGTIYDSDLIELWSHFKRINIYFSLDSYKEINKYLRYPSLFDTIEKNLHLFDMNAPDNVEMDFLATVSNLSFYYIPEFVKWIVDQNFTRICFKDSDDYGPGWIFNGVVHYPEFLNPKVLPPSVKKAITMKILRHIDEYKDTMIFANLKGYVDMMNSEDLSWRLPELKEYLTNLDELRYTDYKKTFKELIDLGLFNDVF